MLYVYECYLCMYVYIRVISTRPIIIVAYEGVSEARCL